MAKVEVTETGVVLTLELPEGEAYEAVCALEWALFMHQIEADKLARRLAFQPLTMERYVTRARMCGWLAHKLVPLTATLRREKRKGASS